MRQLLMLGEGDAVLPTDWCRPLELQTMGGGHSDALSLRNMYSGLPENNVKWVRVRDVFGPAWYHATVSSITKAGLSYEFVRGEIPESHQLDMSDYTSIGNALT